jgi:flagellin
MSNITLSAAQTATLLQLQNVTSLFNTTSNDLNTGKKVNSAADDPLAYFQSQSLYNRSSEFQSYKTNIDQSVQAVTGALDATSAAGTLLKQLLGTLQGARGESANALRSVTTQIKTLGQQISQLVQDATYQGLNILTNSSTTLSTQFSNRTAATLVINGFSLCATGNASARSIFTNSTSTHNLFNADGSINFNALIYTTQSFGTSSAGIGVLSGLSQVLISGAAGGLAATVAQAVFTDSINRLEAAINQINSISGQLGTNVAILQARSSFSANYAATLSGGGDKLTLADLNLEAANSQSLQLRQSIGISTLGVAATQQQSILNLLK